MTENDINTYYNYPIKIQGEKMASSLAKLALVLFITITYANAEDYRITIGKAVKEALTPVSHTDIKTQGKMLARSYGFKEGRDYCDDEQNIDSLTLVRETAVEVAVEAASVPAAVGIASAVGTTASTGTAIASLGGAAATSATLAAIGSSAVGTAVGGAAAVVGIVAAPAVIGGAIVVGMAAGVAYGVNTVINWW